MGGSSKEEFLTEGGGAINCEFFNSEFYGKEQHDISTDLKIC